MIEYYGVKKRSGKWIIGWYAADKHDWRQICICDTHQEALQKIRSLNQEDLEYEKDRR